MIGAIIGDIVGSVYEHRPIKTTDFPLLTPESHFTDDTVLTVAVADAILNGTDYADALAAYAARHPRAGYGTAFRKWAGAWERHPYDSLGNGSAMRVSPVGFAFEGVRAVVREATRSAEVTHNHPEGVTGAQAAALAVLLARRGQSKAAIKETIAMRFGYNLDRTLAEIRPTYSFDVTCQGTVPEAIIAFLEADSFEGAVRNAVSLGGDSDTLACIAGGIAEAFYGGVPGDIEEEALSKLTPDLCAVVAAFKARYGRRC